MMTGSDGPENYVKIPSTVKWPLKPLVSHNSYYKNARVSAQVYVFRNIT